MWVLPVEHIENTLGKRKNFLQTHQTSLNPQQESGCWDIIQQLKTTDIHTRGKNGNIFVKEYHAQKKGGLRKSKFGEKSVPVYGGIIGTTTSCSYFFLNDSLSPALQMHQ